MKLCNIHIKNLIILSVSGIFKGFKNWQKVAEICCQLVHDWASRGVALFLIWRHRLIYMALTLCEHACKTVFDVKPGIDPRPSPARSWDKAYQISGCTPARKKFRCCEKYKLLLEQLQVCIFAKIVFGVNTHRIYIVPLTQLLFLTISIFLLHNTMIQHGCIISILCLYQHSGTMPCRHLAP